MRIIKTLGCVLLGTLFSLSGQAQTIPNGGFEQPVQGPPIYQTSYNFGSTAITGWTVSEGFVDIVNPSQSGPMMQNGVTGAAFEGNQALNLASSGGGLRSQYAVSANDVVTLSFAFGTANTLVGDGEASVEVTFGGQTTTFFIENTSATIGWIQQSLTNLVLTGSGNSTLEFRSDDDPFESVTLIDDVRLTIIPGGLTNSTFTNINVTNFVMTNGSSISIPKPSLPGQVDTRYDAGGGLANLGISPVVVSHSELLSDGKLLLCGSFASYRGVSTPNFARINADGRLDDTFFHGYGGASRVNEFVVQPDDRIVVVGAFDAFHEITYRRVARLLKDGEPDRSFRPGNGADAEINAVALDSAGNIYVGGDFQTFDATNRSRIARLLPNGKLDLSFDPGAGFNGPVNDIIVLSNGKILVGGQFSSYNTFPRNGLVQLNSDGTLDMTFTAPFEATANVKEIILASNGRIVAGGEFNLVGSNGRRNIARFNTDGTLDATFGSSAINSGANAAVNALASCADGTLLIGGDFTTVDGFIRMRMAKLGPDGTVDRSSQTVSRPQVLTNQVVATNMVTVITTNLTSGTVTTSNVFGFFTNATTFVPLTTNTPPTPAQTTFFTTNSVVVTNQALVLEIQDIQTFGLNGGANASVTELVLDSAERAYVTGSFTNVAGISARGLVRLLSCNPTVASATVPTAGISGLLLDAGSGSPIAGATVQSSGGSAVSAADGTFVLLGLPLGTNSLSIAVSNQMATPVSVILSNTSIQTITFNVVLVPSVLASQLIAHYPFHGNADDESVNANHATTVTATLTTNRFGEINEAYDFGTGANDIIEAPHQSYLNFPNQGNFTISLWGRLDAPSTGGVFIGKDNGGGGNKKWFFIYGQPPGAPAGLNLNFHIQDLPALSPSGTWNGSSQFNAQPGEWHHYVVVKLGTVYSMYVDGALVGSGTGPHVPNGITNTLTMGQAENAFNIDGALDDVRIYGRSLSTSDIQLLHQIESSATVTNVTSIGVPGPPRIDTQPQDLYELTGANSLLSAEVSGSLPFGYQWFHDGSPLLGETASTLNFSSLTIPNGGEYQLVVTNPLGGATSRVAQVAILSQTAPFVFLQPESVVVDLGGTASFEVMAGGTRPLFYQWRHDGVVVPNAGGPLLTLTNVQTANEGSYRITVANSFGNVFSKNVNLLVATPPVITNFAFNPGPQVTAGTTATAFVEVSGKGPFDYRWFFDGTLIPTAVGSNIIFQSVHFTNGGNYSVIVSNVLGSVTNAPITLTVDSPPIITVEPQNQFQTIGRAANLGVTVIGTAPISYQWRKDGVNLAGEIANQLSFTNVQQTDVGFYSVIVSNSLGAVTSRLARVDVVLERALLPWAVGSGGSGIDVGESVAVDSSGNIYVCGKFEGTAQFGTNTLVSAGLEDMFILRLDASGNTIWAKRFGGAGFDVAKDITTDSNGDILVTGSFEGTVDFGGTTLTNANATSFGDLFVARFTSDGTLTWARRDGMPFVSDIGNCVTVDATQNAYVAGHSTLDTFGGTTVTNHGRILLAKYDSLGNRVWARKAGGGMSGAQDTGESVAVDNSGNVFLGGTFHSVVFTNDSTGLSSRGFADGFISKYDGNGTPQWTRQIGGVGADSALGIATVGGNAVVVGQFSATNVVGGVSLVSEGGTLPDGYVINYDAAGNVVWAKRLGGSGADAVRDVAIDAAGAVYITGFFQGTATFGARTSISIAGTTDIFAARLRNDGTFEFVQQAGGDDISGEFGNGIAVDSAGNGVFTGSFRGTLVAGGTSLVTSGLDDVFVSRLISPPALTIDVTGGQLIFSWPSFWTGFGVQVNDQFLHSTNWQNVSLSSSNLVGDRIFITNTATTNVQFFRLLRP